MDVSRYAPSPWDTSLHCNDVSNWLGASLNWSPPLSVMLINTAFSHSNEECSPYFLVITNQTQARDDIDGLMQERRNSIANALEYVFLAPSHPYKECHLWVTLDPCVMMVGEAVPLEFNRQTQCLLVTTLAPGMEWLLWHQIGVRRRRTRMWFFSSNFTQPCQRN